MASQMGYMRVSIRRIRVKDLMKEVTKMDVS